MIYRILFAVFTALKNISTRTTVIGRDNMPSGSCIVVANHVNLLDSPILGISLSRRAYFMAKEELFDNRLVGFLTRQFGGFPVAKGRLDRRAGKTAMEHLKCGHALVIFPEGKRSPDGRLGPAYSGAALLGSRSGTSVVPVGITGTGQLTGKTWFLRRPRITLNIGQPFILSRHDGKLSKDTTAQLTTEIMRHITAQLPEEYRGKYGKL